MNARVLLVLTLLCSEVIQSSPLSDRVIMVINTQPVTHWQVETHLNLKLALHAKENNVSPIQEVDWPRGLDTYIRDQVILQESAKQVGFKPSKDVVKASINLLNNNLKNSPNLAKRLVELQVTEKDIYSSVVKQLTIAGFKKTRERINQGVNSTGQSDNKDALTTDPVEQRNSVNKLEEDLLRQAVVRWYENGSLYKN